MVTLKWDEAKKFYESEARAEGQEQTHISAIGNLMETSHLTTQQAMDALNPLVAKQKRYVTLIQTIRRWASQNGETPFCDARFSCRQS